MGRGKKRALFLVAALAVMALGAWAYAHTLPDSWDVQRSEIIEATPDQIYARLNELKRWDEWKPWGSRKDASFELSFDGPPSGEGATLRWRNRMAGQGTLKISEAQPGKGVWYEMTLLKGGQYRGSFVLTPLTGGTQLTWTQTGEASDNPFSRYFGLVAERVLGPEMEAALSRLKTLSEGL